MFKILVLLAVSLPLVFAQSGTVKAGSQPIPGASVRATQGERSLVTLTDDNGVFRFDGMTPGAWVIEADMFGFDHLRREVQVASTPTNLDLTLQLSARAAVPTQAPAPPCARPAAQNNQSANAAPNFPAQPDAGAFTPQVSADSSNESFVVNGTVSDALRTNQADFAGFNPGGFGQNGGFPGGDQGQFNGPGGVGGPVGDQPAGGGRGGRGGGGGGGNFNAGGGGPGGFPGGGGGFPGGGGRGGGGGGGRGGGGRGGRGQQNANFIGNRARRSANQIRTQVFFTAQNSAFNARPFSLNGQDQVKSSYGNNRYRREHGRTADHPQVIRRQQGSEFHGDLQRSLVAEPVQLHTHLADRGGAQW